MTRVQSSGPGNGSPTAQPRRFLQIACAPGLLTPMEEKAVLTDSKISPEEYREILLLDEFLTRHVRHDGLRTVQCMLLWTEWVRVFQKKTHRFPRVILENEFREVITGRLGVTIMTDEYRGAVYPGLRFIP